MASGWRDGCGCAVLRLSLSIPRASRYRANILAARREAPLQHGAIPTVEEEDARRPNRERGNLVTEQTRIVNQIKAVLTRFGIRTFRPTLRKAEEQLDGLRTAEGDNLREVWPRLSSDEKKLFDVIARAYLAALMPDFRYRQTTATLDVRGFDFRASGRQPIDLGWRAAFPDWQPADEKGDEAQLLPPLRNGETAQLNDPKIEEKETRPPPRYNEGTLIEAMQNAWRFVDDEVLRERLKEAKGIGTPATRAEIIGGLKKQNFLIAQGKQIVPTQTGLSLFGVLKQADPALIDPGVTAQLECLLDDVVVGTQEMVGAIDAVCDVAQRIISKLKEGAAAGGPPLLGAAIGNYAGGYPPTPAMKRFADSLARQKGIKLPPGYKTSM